MVVRAPKGSTEAMYFAKGQTQQLVSMLGVPTADWPDIQDALDFNSQYGLWVSAPPGTSETYPSYYGGVYVTKHGLFPFYNVEDKNTPSFRARTRVEGENASYLHLPDNLRVLLQSEVDSRGRIAPIGAVEVSRDEESGVLVDWTFLSSSIQPVYAASSPTGFDVISLTSIPNEILAAADSIYFDFWGNASSAYPGDKSYELILAGTKVQVENPDGTGVVDIGTISGNVINITGTNASGNDTFMFIDFEQIVSSAPYRTTSGDWISTADEATYRGLLHDAILARMKWILNVKDDTYMTIAQKTPTEKETILTFTDIGYDKYAYDLSLSAYKDEPYVLANSPVPYPTAVDAENDDGLYVQFFSNANIGKAGIYQTLGPSLPPKNVTSSYRTRYVRVKDAGIRRTNMGTVRDRDPDVLAMVDQIYYIDSNSNLILCKTELAPEGTMNPRKAVNYNTLTFSVKEEVYPGKLTSGGTFTGSLSETGKDTYGANIYFQEILPDNALSFIEVNVYKTFDDDLNGGGFFTGYRIVDSRAFGGSKTVTTGSLGVPGLQGQRYVKKVVGDLIAEGTTGGIVEDRFTPVLLDGWIEAGKSVYEPALVFVEPTGHEALKESLYSLRASTHKMATYLAPRKLSGSERADLNSIVVTGRITGTAQPVNEFLRKDTYTGKKYWTSLVGAYGAKCMRIIEGKLGGWAPMFTDIGGYGGQLPVTVERAKYEFTAEEQQILDEKGLNPIILDPTYGVMVISQKTTQDPDNLNDWSYLGHSMAFDLFKREIRDNVMIPQIGKPNDSYYQAMRQRQCEAILNRRTGGTQPIWAAGKVEIANVNTDDIKAQRKFKIKITVKVNIFSEWVELEFVNVSQSTQL